MFKSTTKLILALTVTGVMTLSSYASEFKAGDLTLTDPFSRATPAAAPVAGGFVTISNGGSEPDRLVSGSAPFAGVVEIHQTSMEGDVMKMQKVEDGIVIPAGETVALKPGSYHIMFMKLQEPLKEGETRKATLVFEKAGPVEIEFSVLALGAKGAHADHGDAKKMDHSAHGKKDDHVEHKKTN
ncbi:MAG: copper chaperone PCu(A)C [Stappiaceae bacterium]